MEREKTLGPEDLWHIKLGPAVRLLPVPAPPLGHRSGSVLARSSIHQDHRSPEVADWDKRESRCHMDSVGQCTSVRQKMGPAVWWTPLPPGQAQPQGRASESVRARWATFAGAGVITISFKF